MNVQNWKKMLATVVLPGLLAACAASPPARDRATPTPEAEAGVYYVERGDTLYSIAFRHGVDWREVAHLNQIGPPHTIYPGQPLRLPQPPEIEAPEPAPSEPVARIERPEVGEPRDIGEVEEEMTEPAPETRAPPPGAPDTEPVAEVEPGPEAEPETEPEPEPVPETRAPAPPAAERSVAGIQWRWPTAGRVVRGFDAAATRKGIGIAGDEGQPVVASANGQVVYSGTGLLGYGELIIVKHSDSLLSAYGHNRRRLVSEGERISAGQTIAEMGRNERNEVLLHFEIRNNGQPANPLDYLPSR